MRIAAIQLDSIVGDIEGNSTKILDRVLAAHGAGAEIAVTPELSLVGYPPRDLLLREGLSESAVAASQRLAAQLAARGAGSMAVLVGLPAPIRGANRPLANAVALLRGGVVEATYAKRLLPAYDVFDETRYFAPGSANLTFIASGRTVGVLVCEDLWQGDDVAESGRYAANPVADTVAAGADLLFVPSASPFFVGKHARRLDLLRARARDSGAPIVSVNAVGANDDFVFDGGSCAITPTGTQFHAARFREDTLIVELSHAGSGPTALETEEELARAIILAIAGYVRKSGHDKVLIGLSGGIDSALVAALAVAALGADAVRGVSMPGPHSSRGSIDDAAESARVLGMRPPDSLSVTAAYEQFRSHLAGAATIEGLTDENLQSRLRGLTLMTLSNATGALVLATGNKSELAVGYATLYGDMCGGLAPLGDLLKGQVYALSRWLNLNHRSVGLAQPPIPEASIHKPPSAELRPDQCDQDSLPPYADLDRIIALFVDEERSPESIARETGLDRALVDRWTAAIDRAHYKRFQAPIIPKLSARAFGPGRRLPLAMRSRPGGG